jgi:hypothetical protein
MSAPSSKTQFLLPPRNMYTSETYTVQWRGVKKGPWNLAGLKAALHSGEINSMYQVQVGGGQWTLLREFMEAQESREEEEAQASADQSAQLRADAARQQAAYEGQVKNLEESLRQFQEDAREAAREAAATPPPAAAPMGWPMPVYMPMPARRTCGMAIASFVLSFFVWFPLVGLIPWLLSVIFGHIALSKCRQDPGLGGRGLAIAGLIIAYLSLAPTLILLISLLVPLLNSGSY